MRLLMITTGYLPYTFSENLCNAKLVYALHEAGIEVDVITKAEQDLAYQKEWEPQWLPLKKHTFEIVYPVGNRVSRLLDYILSGIIMHRHVNGVRWARRAYQAATSLMTEKKYDAILTRSPSTISHLVGMKLKSKTGIKWIANWNDPINAIWPEPLTIHPKAWIKTREIAYTKKLLYSADINSFPADSLREHFNSFFPELITKRTEIIPHIGLSETLFPNTPSYPNRILRLCHFGNLVDVRDPRPLFKAMKELIDEGYHNFHLDIIGITDDEKWRLIEEYDLQNHVTILGSCSYFKSLEYMQQYDVLVLIEGQYEKGIFFASKITDYAQTGKPIFAISPKTGFAATLINEHGGGIAIDNKDYLEIKRELLRLLDLWEKRLTGSLSSKGIYQLFSPKVIVSQYLTIIKE